MARSAAFGSKVVVLDEPTAALGVKEGNRVLQLIRDVRDRRLPVILVSHNMPHVFEVADRSTSSASAGGRRVITPQSHSMSEAVAIMTGAAEPATRRSPEQAASGRCRRPLSCNGVA